MDCLLFIVITTPQSTLCYKSQCTIYSAFSIHSPSLSHMHKLRPQPSVAIWVSKDLLSHRCSQVMSDSEKNQECWGPPRRAQAQLLFTPNWTHVGWLPAKPVTNDWPFYRKLTSWGKANIQKRHYQDSGSGKTIKKALLPTLKSRLKTKGYQVFAIWACGIWEHVDLRSLCWQNVCHLFRCNL